VNKTNKLIYITFICLFIIYLFNANNIILIFDQNEKIEKINFQSLQSNSEAYVNLDSCENIGGLLETVYFQGWAFCETENDNIEKKINLIFKSVDSEDCYKVETKAQLREDVYAFFHEEKKIYNGMTGVECQFSTINIKNGKYRFYVQVVENDINYGLKDMGIIYVKDKNGLNLLK